jgi:hypothetical protein
VFATQLALDVNYFFARVGFLSASAYPAIRHFAPYVNVDKMIRPVLAVCPRLKLG